MVALNTFSGVRMPIWLLGGLKRRQCSWWVVAVVRMVMARALSNENNNISQTSACLRDSRPRSGRPLLLQSHNGSMGGCSLIKNVVLRAKAVDVEQASAKADALWQAAGG
jgi:hypothetical protein